MNRIVDYQNLTEKIKNWIISYTIEHNIESLIVGVSGGIDSAVVSTLCASTGIPTIVVGLPLNSDNTNTGLSNLQMKFITENFTNTRSEEIDLGNIFNVLKSKFVDKYPSELGFANSKSRLRMISLYQIAASTSGIVVGTGNKVEDFGVGFYTKYGDGGVDISPIADLYKSEVRELGKYLGVPQEIIDAEPTDGLWDDNRKDEQQIGSSYEELEWVMEYGLDKWERNVTVSEKENHVITNFVNFNRKNKHKMNPIPVFSLKENKIL